MDSILFYGDKDEATRRQVRSAAAQHSHRIGPRKPKASKRPSESEGTTQQKRRSLQKANPTITVAPFAVGTAGKIAPAHATTSSRPATSGGGFHDAGSGRGVLVPASLESPPSSGSNVVASREEDEVKRRAAHARFEQLQALHEGQATPEGHEHQHDALPPMLPQESIIAPAMSPLVIERIEQHRQESASSASHTRSSSQTSTQSPTTRLPQYSWTEYPRYALGSSGLHALAHAATEYHSIDGRSPSSAPRDEVPNYHQLGAEALNSRHPSHGSPPQMVPQLPLPGQSAMKRPSEEGEPYGYAHYHGASEGSRNGDVKPPVRPG